MCSLPTVTRVIHVLGETLVMTSGARPSQWEGRTPEGYYVYICYRHGWLVVGVGWTRDDATSPENQKYAAHIGGPFEGTMFRGDMYRNLLGVVTVC